jgi:hypothetical protein
MRIVVRGEHFPGRVLGDYHDVHVGLQVHTRPVDLVPGDAPKAEWVAEVEVVDYGGTPDFHGPAVYGSPGERFLYLTWGTYDGSTFDMFRRAKLMLDEAGIGLTAAEAIATVDLTDAGGMPRCARIRPPAIRWEVHDAPG